MIESILLRGEWLNGFLEDSCESEFDSLLREASAGDEKAFEQLMNSYIKIIYNYILLHVTSHEDANDILQEAMLGIWQGISTFDRKSSFRTWAIGITRRKIADHYRRYYKNMDHRKNDIADYDNDLFTDYEIDRLTDKVTVQDALDSLNSQEKELVYLIFNAQLTYKQVERITGLPEGTIKSRMFTLRKKLKKILKEEGYHE